MLVEGLQKEVHSTQSATQRLLVILQSQSHSSMSIPLFAPFRHLLRRGIILLLDLVAILNLF